MNLPSPELCKELYELSGWKDTQSSYNEEISQEQGLVPGILLPGYPLGYLLRKLPEVFNDNTEDLELLTLQVTSNGWQAFYYHLSDHTYGDESVIADTPEDAACKLAIELFKAGVLTK